MSAPKIFSVQVLENQMLSVRFANDVVKIYDCKQISHLERFRLLKNDAFFKTVRVDIGGNGISWNDMIDLSEVELWANGKETGSPATD